eukprot:g1568.t1
MEAFLEPAGAGNQVAVEQCARYCGELAYKYFAVQYKMQCFCSNDLEKTKAQGESTHSDVAYPYLGCWHDSTTSPRLMEAKTNLPQVLPVNGYQYGVAWCAHYCAKTATGAPYDYFAVQYQNECYCSNDLEGPEGVKSKGAANGSCEQCNTNNEGDKKKGLECGGGYKNSVYARKRTNIFIYNQAAYIYMYGLRPAPLGAAAPGAIMDRARRACSTADRRHTVHRCFYMPKTKNYYKYKYNYKQGNGR